MDGLLRRELEAIARNRHSGAAELALRAATALRAWLRRRPKPTADELVAIARTLLKAQPDMAPLVRLANQVALAVEHCKPSKALAVTRFTSVLKAGPERIAERFLKALPGGPRLVIDTYSYSSTVLKAITGAAGRIGWVFCSESRPGLEGRRTAEAIARAGIGVGFVVDAFLPAYLAGADGLVIGADAVTQSGFGTKVGPNALIVCALENGTPVSVLADTSKFLPPALVLPARPSGGPREEVWAEPPKRVIVVNRYFEHIPYRRGIRVLTERGWMTPARVRRELKRIRVSPRLLALQR